MKKSQVIIIAGLVSALSLVGLPQTVLADGDQVVGDGTASETSPANPNHPTQGGVSAGMNQESDGAGEYDSNVDYGSDNEGSDAGDTDPSASVPGENPENTTQSSSPSVTPSDNHHASPISPNGNGTQDSHSAENSQPQANSTEPQSSQTDEAGNDSRDTNSTDEQAPEEAEQPEITQSQDDTTQQNETEGSDTHQPFWDLMVIFLIVAGCLAVATGLIAMIVNKVSQNKMEKSAKAQPRTGLTIEKHVAQKSKKSTSKKATD